MPVGLTRCSSTSGDDQYDGREHDNNDEQDELLGGSSSLDAEHPIDLGVTDHTLAVIIWPVSTLCQLDALQIRSGGSIDRRQTGFQGA